MAAKSRKTPSRKVPQNERTTSVPQSTAKRTASIFAVLDDLEDDAAPFADFAGQGSAEWRIERRYRRRKDGAMVMYWNYRARKIRHQDGRRIVPYRKGGKKLI